ncbi:helix-turn-helix transcriptional regulator [Umboniibacter marinipuniceus]|uniref:AlpA family transcriptional regulator n=1 Tax=Umboniibacter marinipuniceus TaxID=569599 RepID=A0A3M0AJ23_9GAMM|nr:AlpA family phage regulatory protein [Umboniibacter marinipuniceus]RMA82718.1 AlpA family transcriptional regulator [Umboniibacter marinipuniceus]
MNKNKDLLLLRKPHVAALLSISTSTLDRWVAGGIFPAPLKFGSYKSCAMWRYEDLLSWVAAND